jgi:hypothetical protein
MLESLPVSKYRFKKMSFSKSTRPLLIGLTFQIENVHNKLTIILTVITFIHTHSKQNSLFLEINQIETKHKQAYSEKFEVNIFEIISGSSEA